MNVLLDVIVAAIIAVTVYLGFRRGFVKTVMGAVGFFVALAVAIAFAPALKAEVLESRFTENVKVYAEEAIEKLLDGEEKEDYDELFESENKSNVELMLDSFGLGEKYESFKQSYQEWKDENTQTIKANLVDYLSETAVDVGALIISFVAIFVLARILLRLAEWLLDRFCDLPVLKQANKVLGIVAGVVLALFRVYVFCWLFGQLIPVAEVFGLEFLASANTDSTVVFKFFAEHNLLVDLLK